MTNTDPCHTGSSIWISPTQSTQVEEEQEHRKIVLQEPSLEFLRAGLSQPPRMFVHACARYFDVLGPLITR